VVDTGAPHHLVDGEYAQRRRECEQAASQLGVAALAARRSRAPRRGRRSVGRAGLRRTS
jgi:galactokinase